VLWAAAVPVTHWLGTLRHGKALSPGRWAQCSRRSGGGGGRGSRGGSGGGDKPAVRSSSVGGGAGFGLGGDDGCCEYRLWQPFVGGRRFVVLQALGWGLYALCLLLTMVYTGLQGITAAAPAGWRTAVAGGAVVAQMCIAASLFVFDSDDALPAHDKLMVWRGVSVAVLICSGVAIPLSIMAESAGPLPPQCLRALAAAGFGA
ncbi:unnamed protein product, partial [Phaeothamnion confervicola]